MADIVIRKPRLATVGAILFGSTPFWRLIGRASDIDFLVTIGRWLGGPAVMGALSAWASTFAPLVGALIIAFALRRRTPPLGENAGAIGRATLDEASPLGFATRKDREIAELAQARDALAKDLGTIQASLGVERQRSNALRSTVERWVGWGTVASNEYEALRDRHGKLAAAITDLGFKLGIIRVVAVVPPPAGGPPAVQYPGKSLEERIDMATPVIIAAGPAKEPAPDLPPMPSRPDEIAPGARGRPE